VVVATREEERAKVVLGFKVVWVTEVAMDDVAENSDASCLEGREADLGLRPMCRVTSEHREGLG
jgi:hypothetical protein